ncbi:APC family permease [Dermabacteraceae bacterium TAE3-ERU27]|nr:APC family permease [Dermabacteraceae bacterium TAE3-ERU27]
MSPKQGESPSVSNSGVPAAMAKIGFFPLVCMTTALFLTLRNMPAMAQTGMEMFFFNVLAVFAFLVPTALVAAELGTGWPENGVFGWVEAAFGVRPALLASWLQWVQSLFGLTSILAYAAGTAAYVVNPRLGDNPMFVCVAIVLIYWAATAMNLFGAKGSSKISTVCLLAGVLTPSLLLALAGLFWLVSGEANHLNTTASLLPEWGEENSLLLFLSFIFGFVGIEVSAASIKHVAEPQRNYPRALFVAAFLGFVITLLGALAIAVILPVNGIDTVNGAIQALSAALGRFGLSAAVPILALLISLGTIGQVSTWIVGPVRGLETAGQRGYLPPALLVRNSRGVPYRLLFAQASCVTLIGLCFLVTGSVNATFLILTSVAVILYSLMYVLMFAAAITLRLKQPEVKRSYSVPGGTAGLVIVSLLGGSTVVACLVIGFLPPSPDPLHSGVGYALTLCALSLLLVAVPLLAKPRWRQRK